MEFSIFELGDMQKVRSLNIPKFGTPPPCSPLFVSELNSSTDHEVHIIYRQWPKCFLKQIIVKTKNQD